jgi:hypothetical protein
LMMVGVLVLREVSAWGRDDRRVGYEELCGCFAGGCGIVGRV